MKTLRARVEGYEVPQEQIDAAAGGTKFEEADIGYHSQYGMEDEQQAPTVGFSPIETRGNGFERAMGDTS
jgi:hypothetical protein